MKNLKYPIYPNSLKYPIEIDINFTVNNQQDLLDKYHALLEEVKAGDFRHHTLVRLGKMAVLTESIQY